MASGPVALTVPSKSVSQICRRRVRIGFKSSQPFQRIINFAITRGDDAGPPLYCRMAVQNGHYVRQSVLYHYCWKPLNLQAEK